MPKPVPPPPPQPSLAETRAAVRLVALLSVVAAVLFFAYAQTVHLNGFMVRYGRDNGASWNLWKASRLKERSLRTDGIGPVAWLVGSSILREAFDEDQINDELRAAKSKWRVAKFGQTRGATGLSAGMLTHLPVKPGDLIVHNVAMENFRRNWLDFTGLPAWRVSLLLTPRQLWDISEWSTQDKLEQAVAVPYDFFRFHEDAMGGWVKWLSAPWQGVPHVRRKSAHLSFKTIETHPNLRSARSRGEDSPYYLAPEDVDLEPGQFNVDGLIRMRAFAAAHGAALALVDVPPRQEYSQTFMGPEVRAAWDAWRAAQPELVYFPQLPEDDYYDMKHPNFRGRPKVSSTLVQWLQEPFHGEPTPTRWPLDAPYLDAPSDEGL